MLTNKKDQPVNHKESMNLVFANYSKENAMYPLTTGEIAESQKKDNVLKKLVKTDNYTSELIENTKVLCKDGKLVIPKDLQHRAVEWYHHYLQHPGKPIWKKPFKLQCTGKVCIVPSVHMSRNVKNVR